MSRSVPGGNWIKGFQYWMKESEAPDSYILWAAVALIAGSTMRQLRMQWVYHQYYTNHYIILVGPAGVVHKSSTIDMARRIFREIGVPFASEALSKEALIEQMIKRGDREGLGNYAALTALPDEFSDLIRPSGPPMLEFLTSIYGCPDQWEYTTRLRGTELINNAFLNMFGGTTPTWIANEFDITFVDQGFAARTLFIHEMEPRFRKAKVKITNDMYKMYRCLVDDLAHISTLKGEFQWESEEAEDWFAHWYEHELPLEMKKVDYKLTSYMGRKATHILKLAMVLQLSESDELYVTLKNLKEAKLWLDTLEHSMDRTFSAVGRNTYANDLERIYNEVKEAGGMTLEEITRRNYSALPKVALDETLSTLQQMGKLVVVLNEGRMLYKPKGL